MTSPLELALQRLAEVREKSEITRVAVPRGGASWPPLGDADVPEDHAALERRHALVVALGQLAVDDEVDAWVERAIALEARLAVLEAGAMAAPARLRSVAQLPRVRWAYERGWLLVNDPESGEQFSIPAREAPTGWVRLAQQARNSPLPQRR